METRNPCGHRINNTLLNPFSTILFTDKDTPCKMRRQGMSLFAQKVGISFPAWFLKEEDKSSEEFENNFRNRLVVVFKPSEMQSDIL